MRSVAAPCYSDEASLTGKEETMNSKERQIIEGLKVVCKCKNIRQRDFLKHIKAGVMTVEELKKATGAGSGTCKGKTAHRGSRNYSLQYRNDSPLDDQLHLTNLQSY